MFKKLIAIWKDTPYTIRNRVKHRSLNAIMYVTLIVMLFPIFWMMYSSVKGNAEILDGKVPIANQARDVLKLEQAEDFAWVITTDGAVNKLSNEGNLIFRKQLKTWSTNAIMGSEHIWISSSDKGLQRVLKSNPKKVKRLKLPWPPRMDVNKVARTVMALDEEKGRLWVTLGYKNFGTILEVDTAAMQVVKKYDLVKELPESSIKLTLSALKYKNGKLYVSSSRGIAEFNVNSGKYIGIYQVKLLENVAIQQFVSQSKNKMLAVAARSLYSYDLVSRKMNKIYVSAEKAENLNPIGIAKVFGDKIYVGLSRGLDVLDKNGYRIKRHNGPFFDDIDDKGHPINPDKPVLSEISEIVKRDNNVLLLGSTVSRVSIFDIKDNKLLDRMIVDKNSYKMVRWRNYVDLWNNLPFGLFLRNSFLISGLTMFFSMIIATLTAYALVRFRFPGSNTFSTSILATQMVPGIMFLLPIYLTFEAITRYTGIPVKGTIPGLVFIYSTFFLPFSVWIMRGFFAAIPVSLEEAATIDGCTPFQVFWKIALPLAVPGIVATGVFVFLIAWDELMFAWVLTSDASRTIPAGIRLFVGNFQNRFDLLMAASTVATIPVMIMFFLLQKHIVSGLTAGAVKG